MSSPLIAIPAIILAVLLGVVALAAVVFLLTKLFGLVWVVLGNVFKFIGAEIRDVAKLVGAVIVIPIFSLLVLLNVVIGRWSASAHFGRSVGAEFHSIGASFYRLVVGNPARLFGLGSALQGVEERLPAAMAEAPGRDKPKGGKAGRFEGYKIIGSLPVGGSGAKLYIAEPEVMKRAALERRGMMNVDRVVIKAFSQSDGSTLDQIVRESRALEAAKELGLVLEHSSEADRFYYVMRYVPGDSLGVVTHRLHAASPSDGLDAKNLKLAMGYAADLIDALHTYHRGGLWHKDIKPDNIIIDRDDNRAHLVDFGLVTPMRSAMTLTTHGTEYFRDPELVRQALRGVKVNEIDGAKFDVYSAGAVMFSVIENSFPAHGGLSQITKKCPDALKWIVRRAMADYQRRYTSADEMRRDLEVVIQASNPFALKPVDLPSMKSDAGEHTPEARPEPMPERPRPEPVSEPGPARAAEAFAGGAAASAGPVGAFAASGRKEAPKLRVSDWWKGRYVVSNLQCAQCGYSLQGLSANTTRCPECGSPISGSNPSTPQKDTPFENADRAVRTAERVAKKYAGAWETATSTMRETARAHRDNAKAEKRGSPAARVVPVENRASAADQLRNARGRARAARARARQRMSGRAMSIRQARKSSGLGGSKGLVFGLVVALCVFFAMAGLVGKLFQDMTRTTVQINSPTPSASAWASDGSSVSVNLPLTGDSNASADQDVLDRMPRLTERVLVLSDLASPLDAQVKASIDRAFSLLNKAGARLTGDLVTTTKDADSGLLDLLARVRTDRGALPLDSDELGSRLSSTVREIRSDYNGVLWLAPVKGKPQSVRYYLIGPDGVVTARADSVDQVVDLADEIKKLD